MEMIEIADTQSAGLVARPEASEGLGIHGLFHFTCVGADGAVKWEADCPNTVTTEGKNAILDKFLGLGAAYAGVAMGLHTTVGNASSTYATPGVQVETTAYAARLTPSFSAASAGAKTTSATVDFSITNTATITGAFIALGAAGILTAGNTAATAILLSSGTFTGSSRAVVNGDTLKVSYTLTLT